MARYFVCVGDGPIVGPVRLDQLVRGLATKRVPNEALACVEGEQDWRPVGEIVDDVMSADEKTLFAAPVVVERRGAPPREPSSESPRRETFDIVQCAACKADTPIREIGKPSKCLQCGNDSTAVKAPNPLSRVKTTEVNVTTPKGNPQVVDSRIAVAGGLVLTVLLVAGWYSTKGSRSERTAAAPTNPVLTTPPPPTCESMCDHAIGCVASRLGVAATGEIFRDGRDNCIAGCRGAPQEKITCWANARCDQIEKEQGLTRKVCPTP